VVPVWPPAGSGAPGRPPPRPGWRRCCRPWRPSGPRRGASCPRRTRRRRPRRCRLRRGRCRPPRPAARAPRPAGPRLATPRAATRGGTGPGGRGARTCRRTVAIWGRATGATQVASTPPAIAGRIWCSSASWCSSRRCHGPTARSVQSAARPASSMAATRGARSRAVVVAPKSTATGACARTASASTRAWGWLRYGVRAGSSATSTTSAPNRPASSAARPHPARRRTRPPTPRAVPARPPW